MKSIQLKPFRIHRFLAIPLLSALSLFTQATPLIAKEPATKAKTVEEKKGGTWSSAPRSAPIILVPACPLVTGPASDCSTSGMASGRGSGSCPKAGPTQVPEDTYWPAGFMGQVTMIIPSRKIVVVRMGPSLKNVYPYLNETIGRILKAVP